MIFWGLNNQKWGTSMAGMMVQEKQIKNMDTRPEIIPGESVWRMCEELAEENDKTPLDELKHLVLIGKTAVDLRNKGGGKIADVSHGMVISIEIINKPPESKSPTP